MSTRRKAKAGSDGLINLGPKSRAAMAKVGIHTLKDLQKLGPAKAWLRIRTVWPGFNKLGLWALIGACYGMPWREVPSDLKERYLKEAQR